MKTLLSSFQGLLDENWSQSDSYRYKMLLIGQIGSGKTSFLNLLCNCCLVRRLGFKEGVAKLQHFNDMKLESAELRKQESKTSGAKLYNVELGKLRVGVIDTPGFGGTGGSDHEEHVKKIVGALEVEDYVNCICLIINGRQSSMSRTLRRVLTEITCIVPKEVLGNVIVVFTHTADPLDLEFDTKSLQEYFEGINIEGRHIFFIENPFCKFETAQEKASEKLLEEKLAKGLKKAFEEAGDMLSEMCGTIKNFKPVYTDRFLRLHQKKQETEKAVLDLLTAYDYERRVEARIAKAEEVNTALETKPSTTNFPLLKPCRTGKQFPLETIALFAVQQTAIPIATSPVHVTLASPLTKRL